MVDFILDGLLSEGLIFISFVLLIFLYGPTFAFMTGSPYAGWTSQVNHTKGMHHSNIAAATVQQLYL